MRSITDIRADDIPRIVEDTVYTAVGLGVLGFQRIQVQRQQFNEQVRRSVSCGLGDAREAIDGGLRTIEERLIDLDDRFDEIYEESVEPLLPEVTRAPARQAVALAREVRHQVFEMVEQDGPAATA